MRRGRAVVAACAVLLVGACGGDGIDRGEVEQLLRDHGVTAPAREDVTAGVEAITAVCADRPGTTDATIPLRTDQVRPFIEAGVAKFCPDRLDEVRRLNRS